MHHTTGCQGECVYLLLSARGAAPSITAQDHDIDLRVLLCRELCVLPHPHTFCSTVLQAGSACYAYFPHYRQHITRKGSALLRSRPGMRRPMLAPEEPAADQAASWVLTGQWKQDLDVQVPEVQQRVQAGVQGLCLVLAGAHQQAQCLWQYILSNWPAWKASLQDDAEVVLEYALALIPAWIGALYISTMRACQQVAAWELVQQAVDTGSAAAATAEAALTAATEGAQRAAEQLVQLIKQPR